MYIKNVLKNKHNKNLSEDRMPSVVSIVKDKDPTKCVQKTLDLIGGIKKFIKSEEKILLKPHLVVPLKTETGVTTNPAVISVLIARVLLLILLILMLIITFCFPGFNFHWSLVQRKCLQSFNV